MLARVWSKQNSPAFPVGVRNGTATPENSLAASSKAEHMRIFSSVPKYMPNRSLCVFLTEDLYVNVHSSTLPNGPKLEMTQMPITSRMNR